MKTVPTDRLILVGAEAFMKYVDSDDLRCRDSDSIEDAYHKDWFYELEGETYFTPPAAYINDGNILFINGRHRSILLARHLKRFPFLVGYLDLDHVGMIPTERSRRIFDNIKVGELAEHSMVCLPDLGYGDFKPA